MLGPHGPGNDNPVFRPVEAKQTELPDADDDDVELEERGNHKVGPKPGSDGIYICTRCGKAATAPNKLKATGCKR